MVLLVSSISAYFQYETDCITECRRQQLPCTITEMSPVYFPCDCITTVEACLKRASPDVICLRPNGTSMGGENIWKAYWNYTHPAPLPPPNPQPSRGLNLLLIYAVVVTTILVTHAGSGLIRCLRDAWRRRQYERLNVNPDTGVPRSPESPYFQPTVDI